MESGEEYKHFDRARSVGQFVRGAFPNCSRFRACWRSFHGLYQKVRLLYSLTNIMGIIDQLKPILKLRENPTQPNPTNPTGDKLILSQITSDLHQTFRIFSQPYTNMIYDVKDDPILQVSNQEPSVSFNSPTQPNHVQSSKRLFGYLLNHLSTLSMMSKMIPSSKSPIRNPQFPPSP